MNTEGAELIECPFDPHHKILAKRFQVHLLRCRKNHPTSDKVVCPFNATHYLSPHQLDFHVLRCPERASFERFKSAQNELQKEMKTTNEPEMSIDDGENWESDPDEPTYDPSVHTFRNPILRLKQNAPKAEKKLFRQQERVRIMDLGNHLTITTTKTIKNDIH